MADPNQWPVRPSRRTLLKQLSALPLALQPALLPGEAALLMLPAPLRAAAGAGDAPAPPAFADRYLPRYPARSPLEEVLRLVPPGLDGYRTELYAAQIGGRLADWCRALRDADPRLFAASLSPDVQAASLLPAGETPLRDRAGIRSVRRQFAAGNHAGAAQLLREWQTWPSGTVLSAEAEIPALDAVSDSPPAVRATIRLTTVVRTGKQARQQVIARWQTTWRQGSGDAWLLTRLTPLDETRSTVQGPGFADVTEAALARAPCYLAQLQHGSDYWRSVLDGACGIDVYGNNGIAAGDFDNDGFDDLYVSQPAGLPNRLLRNRGDGTFEDVTERAGVGVLDNTACALFADFRNVGLQDLLVVCGSGPLLFQNRGDGTFALQRDAFHFAQPPQGTFTHAAVADYDRDGRLDIYFCLYSYYLGLDQYHYPTPYFDARNGPPNFLMHNQGDGTFVDRTAASGLSAENDRFSFACACGDSVGGRGPDLYVVNDFGRNNLYRNNGDGTFRAVSESAHVQDVGAGMSACWADVDNDGRQDLYVANMWSAAGLRVSHDAQFHAASTPATRALYQRHARGNALYRSEADGSFTNAGEHAGVEVGRWAWGSDAWDFDHDGHQDLYVTNGYITAPRAPGQQPGDDLGSFFWRQVVGKSPDDTTPSQAYEHGWNALNELIRTDSSWSGNEKNVLFANNGDGTFSDVSGALGLDFLEDGRAFALADLDGDGRLEIIVKNRNAPQLRILHNAMQDLGDAVALRLRGTAGNRDAIGAVVELQCGPLRQTRALQAGTGFLAQHTKELFFGLGSGSELVDATVHWPGGAAQRFTGLPRNARVTLVEGEATFQAMPFGETPAAWKGGTAPVNKAAPEQIPSTIATWLLDPLKAPDFSLPGMDGAAVTLASVRGAPALLHLWTGTHSDNLRALVSQRGSVRVLALNIDPATAQDAARSLARQLRPAFAVAFATDEVAGVYNLIFRYLYDRRGNLPLPTSFLLDAAGNIVRVYQGAVSATGIAQDAAAMPASAADRMRRALPFPGTLYQADFQRNDFTYGVAMFQHGYLSEAAASFEQVIAAHPDDAEAHYNLGTLSLRRNDPAAARLQLERTVQLKPDYPEAWNNLGMLAAQQGQTAEAVRSFQHSLTQRPGYATALLNLGNLYRHERNFAEADHCLQQALRLQPDDPETIYSVGMLAAQQNQTATAKAALQHAIDLRPDYPEALNNLGVLLVREGDAAAAEKLFRACIERVPSFEGSYLNLARLLVGRGQKAEARAELVQLLALHPDSPVGKQALQALDSMP